MCSKIGILIVDNFFVKVKVIHRYIKKSPFYRVFAVDYFF